MFHRKKASWLYNRSNTSLPKHFVQRFWQSWRHYRGGYYRGGTNILKLRGDFLSLRTWLWTLHWVYLYSLLPSSPLTFVALFRPASPHYSSSVRSSKICWQTHPLSEPLAFFRLSPKTILSCCSGHTYRAFLSSHGLPEAHCCRSSKQLRCSKVRTIHRLPFHRWWEWVETSCGWKYLWGWFGSCVRVGLEQSWKKSEKIEAAVYICDKTTNAARDLLQFLWKIYCMRGNQSIWAYSC